MAEARRALAAGDTTKCLAALDRYDHDHPRGAFAQEVVVMRIEVLVKRGDRKSAKALADRFLASHPTSPYAARIRSLTKDPSNP
jgi:outer membrane protein assembly factor BamD (BamD/ComL family)